MPRESTSARVAAIAARGMNDPGSLTLAQIKSVCASCVTQFEKAAAAKKRIEASVKILPKKQGRRR